MYIVKITLFYDDPFSVALIKRCGLIAFCLKMFKPFLKLLVKISLHRISQHDVFAFRSEESTRGVQALRSRSRSTRKQHEAVCALQGTQVRARPRSQEEPRIQGLKLKTTKSLCRTLLLNLPINGNCWKVCSGFLCLKQIFDGLSITILSYNHITRRYTIKR